MLAAQDGIDEPLGPQLSSTPPTATGAGLQLGIPAGFTVKSYQSRHIAFSGALVWNLGTLAFASANVLYERQFDGIPMNVYMGPGVMAGPGGFKDAHDFTMGLKGELGFNFFVGTFEPYVALNPIITLNVRTQGYVGATFGMRYYL